MEKVAVFIKYYSIGKSSPIICLLEFLSDYWQVDIYLENASYLNAKILVKENIKIINLNKKLFLVNKIKFIFKKPKYIHIISVDPHGFILAKTIFPQCRPFYYSLELYFRKNYFNLIYPINVMTKEHRLINEMKGLIIQSTEREDLFRKEYSLSKEIKTFILPVTYSGPSSAAEKNSYYREKYAIPKSSWIILHLGGIQEYHSCIEIAQAIAANKDYFLVFHGYHFGSYAEKLKGTLEREKIKNVIIDEDIYDDIEEMGMVLSASDIGIAWYKDYGENFSSAGKSSGKISAYLRYGLPIVANYYQSTYEAIEESGCGYCIKTVNEIHSALERIVENYDKISNRSKEVYNNIYWFKKYKLSLLNFLEKTH